MNISEEELLVHIKSVIKSNLVYADVQIDKIDKITEHLSADLTDVLENFEIVNGLKTFKETQ